MVMAKISFAKTLAVTVARGLLLSSIAVTNGAVAGAAEVKVLTSVALTSALNELAPKFEQATGNKLNIGYSLIADIRKRILDGETADVIILSRPVMDELDKQELVSNDEKDQHETGLCGWGGGGGNPRKRDIEQTQNHTAN